MEVSKRLFLMHFTTNESIQQFKANLSKDCTFDQEDLVLIGAFTSDQLNLAVCSFNAKITIDGKATFPHSIYRRRNDRPDDRQQLEMTGLYAATTV